MTACARSALPMAIAVSDQFESVEVLARAVARRLAPACRSLSDSEFRDVVARVVSLVVAYRASPAVSAASDASAPPDARAPGP